LASASEDDIPLPSDPKTLLLVGLFTLAFLTALAVAREIAMPLALAIILKLVTQPLVRLLHRLKLPKGLGALLVVLLLLGLIGMVATGLGGPATSWAGKLPEALPKLQEQMPLLKQPLGALQDMMRQMRAFASGTSAGSGGALPISTSTLSLIASSTGNILAGLFTTLLILLYLLIFGDTFLRRVVEILPTFRDKRHAVELSQHVERDLSAYLTTITGINLVVGTCVFLIMLSCGVADPLLWAVLAFLFNFIPILGWIAGILLFAAVGVISSGITWWALAPAGLYLIVHIVEGEVISPMIIARRFTVNPVAVILALIFWYWLWGVMGAILAVPMLAITKIICDSIRPLRALGHFLEG
jgi:predicted PurR-regulated permease PerM